MIPAKGAIRRRMEIRKALHIQGQREIDIYRLLATNANGGKLNVMGIHHVKDAEISTSNANMLRIVVPMASRSRRSFVE